MYGRSRLHLRARVRFEARVALVIVAVRRFPDMTVDEADEVPAGLAGVASVRRVRQQPEHREETHVAEKGRVLHVLEEAELVVPREVRKRAFAGMVPRAGLLEGA